MTNNLKYTFYEIVCKDEDKNFIYIGSTKDFKNRKYQHKTSCINEKNKIYHLQVYKFIRENGGWDNFNMNPIEICECDTKTHARIREQYWIELKKANLNKLRAFSTEEQNKERYKRYMANNTEYYKQYQKQYQTQYQNDKKDKLQEYQKQYKNDNKIKLKEYQKNYRLMKMLEKQAEIQPQFETIELIEE